jgi:hypothetical protein
MLGEDATGEVPKRNRRPDSAAIGLAIETGSSGAYKARKSTSTTNSSSAQKMHRGAVMEQSGHKWPQDYRPRRTPNAQEFIAAISQAHRYQDRKPEYRPT